MAHHFFAFFGSARSFPSAVRRAYLLGAIEGVVVFVFVDEVDFEEMEPVDLV